MSVKLIFMKNNDIINRNMRVAYIDPIPVPGTAPSALQILQTVDAFARLGVEIDLFSTNSTLVPDNILGRPLANGAKIYGLFDFKRRWFFPFSSSKPFFWQVLFALKKGRYDAVLVRNLKLAGRLLENKIGIPVFFESHEIFSQSFVESNGLVSKKNRQKYKYLKDVESRVYRDIAGIFAITRPLADDITAQYDEVSARCWVVPDGVDLPLAERHRMQNAQRNLQDEVKLLYLGSLHKWKGVHHLLHAMCMIENATLIVAGGTDDAISDLQLMAKNLGVDKSVTFIGWVDPLKRFELISSVDICVLPLSSTSIGARYTSPLKLFEYMAMGKPVVAPRVPSILDVLTLQEFGDFLFNVEDSVDLARVVNRLINDSVLRRKYGADLELLAKKYSWDNRVATMIRCIADTLL